VTTQLQLINIIIILLIVLEEPKTNGLAKSAINFTDSEIHLPAIKSPPPKSIFKSSVCLKFEVTRYIHVTAIIEPAIPLSKTL